MDDSFPPPTQPSILSIPEDSPSTTSPRTGSPLATSPPTSPLNALEVPGAEKSQDTVKKLKGNSKFYLLSICIFFY